jgi:asparagine synthase (glutamine-hydrolysing)
MCGIAGFVGADNGREENRRLLGLMCAAIRHRGPDEDGFHVTDGVALGMTRLSIIDLATGSQPIGNEDGQLQVVFNGEIYNYRALRRRLAAAGHLLKTSGDTETLVHLYEDVGADLVHSLRGMFAFALWDERRQALLLARDRLGIKPLYYWERPDGLAFASELRAFLALPGFRPEIDRAGLASYLAFGYVQDPLSIFRGVRKLPPGHRLTWQRGGGVRVERYWTPARPQDPDRDEAAAVEELRARLLDAVDCHLEADVPVGLFLSGGLDSSSVAAAVRHFGRPARTFSIGFAQEEYNEAPDAARVARHLGTEHTEFIVHDCPDILDEVIRAYDEPFADSSAVPTLLVSQLARQHVKVVLSGDGGDEVFGGYTRYLKAANRLELQPRWLRRLASGLGRQLPFGAPGRNRVLDLGRTRRGRYVETVAKPLYTAEGGVAAATLAEEAGPFEELLDASFDAAAGRDFLTQVMLVDMLSYLPGDILTKVDRASMAVSLEARVPLLDHELVEYAVSLPVGLKIRNGQGKWLLREAVRDLLPPEVFTKDKQGFAAPVSHWFRGRLRAGFDAVLQGSGPVLEGFIDLDAGRRIFAEHLSGRREHGSRVWRLFVLARWLHALDQGQLARPNQLDFAPVVSTHGPA